MLLKLSSIFLAALTTVHASGQCGSIRDNTDAHCEPRSASSASSCPAIPNLGGYNFLYLQDPFTFADGSKVTTKDQWACRRDEINQLAQRFELGTFPTTATTTASLDGDTLNIDVSDNGESISFSVSLSRPSGSGPFPAIIAYRFLSIPIPDGVATITFNHEEIAEQQGLASRGQGKFYTLYGSEHSAGATTAWAWGVSRIIDALEQVDANIDPKRVGITGCSRNGKGAFIAGVLEPRLALTIPQESGSGGTNAWRISDWMNAHGINTQTSRHVIRENVWFSRIFDNNAAISVNRIPFDHHLLAAMIAPRGLFAIDQVAIDWLGAQSSYGSLMAGREVYKALGIADNLGFSQSPGHTHCQFPSSQTEDLNAFITKFLLNGNANTNITYTAGDWASSWPGEWTPWTTPILS